MGSTEKKDFFGRTVKEKFPYYPSGVIIPRCKNINGSTINNGPKTKCRTLAPCQGPQRHNAAGAGGGCPDPCQPPSRDTSHIQQSQSHYRNDGHPKVGNSSASANCNDQRARPPSSSSRSSAGPSQRRTGKKYNPTELCGRLAEIVAQELPNCDLDTSFLEDIQRRCRCYWDTLTKYNIHLDEEAVFQELAEKLRGWVRDNQHLIESHSHLNSHTQSASNLDDSEFGNDRDEYDDDSFIPFDENDSDDESLTATPKSKPI